MKEVKSSNIKSIGYENENLIVEYLSGTRYLYKKVPVQLYEQFLEAESKGRFMNSNIKGKFEYEKVVAK